MKRVDSQRTKKAWAGFWVSVAMLAGMGGLAQGLLVPASTSSEPGGTHGLPGPPGPAAGTLECVDPCVVEIDAGPRGAREPMLAIHPTNPDHLVAAVQNIEKGSDGFRAVTTSSHVSFDGGRSWQESGVPTPEPLTGDAIKTFSGDMVTTVLPDGSVLHASIFMEEFVGPNDRVGPLSVLFTAFLPKLFVARSPDGGLTWDPAVVVDEGAGFWAQVDIVSVPPSTVDKPWFTVGPDGTPLLVWSFHVAPGNSEIRWSTSPDGGRTWTEPRTIIDFLGLGRDGMYWGAMPAVAADGTWYVTFFFGQANEESFTGCTKLLLATSQDEGSTWSIRTVVEGNLMQSTQLRLGPPPSGAPGKDGGHARASLDGSGQRLWVSYVVADHPTCSVPDTFDTSAIPGIPVLVASDDGGATWTPPLSLDSTPTVGPEPALDVGMDGTAYVGFFQRTNESTMEWRVVAARGGAALSVITLDANVASHAGFPARVGEYMGLVAVPDGAYTVWIRTSGTSNDLVGAHVTWNRGGPP